MRRIACAVTLLSLVALLGPGIGGAQPTEAPVRLTDVGVDRAEDGITVRLKTSGPVKHEVMLIDSPTRLVIDMPETVYAWRAKPGFTKGFEPIKEIRGSQWKPSISRLVVELTEKAGYRIEERPNGLLLVVEASQRAKSETGGGTAAKPSEARAAAPKGEAKPEAPKAETRVAAPKSEAKPEAPVSSAPSIAATPAPPQVRVAQAQVSTSPAPPVPAQTGAQAPASNGSRLISLDFKDADVVNLLRILAAESGRNIVAGDDVKGRVSVSLRNVTWQQALETILEVRGLTKIEKENVIRIVSVEQLAKEREAQARVEEARRKAEIETRNKEVEAQLKEADLAAKRLATEVAAAEAQARGPLREETIRLSYADPEEVAKTLQGILGIPPEGTQPVAAALVPPGAAIPSGPSPLIAEPPFSQLYGPGAQPRPAPLVSVSHDVLAKGITIRAHKPTNTIFIRHYQADLERIRKLIREQLDVPLPQVKIEARMEILDRNALEQIGIQWGGAGIRRFPVDGRNPALVGSGFATGAPPVGGTGVVGAASENINFTGSSLLPVSPTTGFPVGGNLINLPLSALPTSGGGAALGLLFGIVGRDFNINLALQALATTGKTRTLARPEIVTVENNKAQVSLGEEIPYATVSSAGTQIQFKEALLKLDVTPTVIREKIGDREITKIKMLVVVENNSRGDVVNLGSSGAPPAINRRKAETQVLINEGERLVIGGVTTAIQQNTVRKVPLMGDIPVLGWLFKQREEFETGRELVVFVTPSLVKTEGAQAAQAAPAR